MRRARLLRPVGENALLSSSPPLSPFLVMRYLERAYVSSNVGSRNW